MLVQPDLYEKGHNHGIDQDIALLGIGCRYGRDDWSNLAIKRLTDTVKLDVDSQGVLQRAGPALRDLRPRRLKVAMDNITAAGGRCPGEIAKRWESLEGFIAHSTQPNGYMVPDRRRHRGRAAGRLRPGREDVRRPPHEDRCEVFGDGYVYGRTAWDKPESAFYSIRFGPGLKYHGHEDHLGVTYYAQGRDVLVDAGFPLLREARLPQLDHVPRGAQRARRRGQRSGSAARRATAMSSPRSGRPAELPADRQGLRRARTRSVLVNHDEDVMAVLDTVPRAPRIRNLWHFARDSLKLVSNRGGRVVVKDKAGWTARWCSLDAVLQAGERAEGGQRTAAIPTRAGSPPPTCRRSPPPRSSPPRRRSAADDHRARHRRAQGLMRRRQGHLRRRPRPAFSEFNGRIFIG